MAEISRDGIFRVVVDPTDESAKAFIECVNNALGVQLRGMEAVSGFGGGSGDGE